MKRLYKSKDKKLSGVCGGIGEYLGIDSTVIRVLAVALGLITGILPLLVAYIICAFIIPEDDGTIDV